MVAESLTDKLRSIRRMSSEQEARDFDLLLTELAKDPALSWPDIWPIFDDGTEAPEVMWGLVHLVEARRDSYVPELVGAFDAMCASDARGWTGLLVKRALNNPATRSVLVAEIRRSASCVDGIVALLNELASTKPPPLGANAREAIDAVRR